MLTELAIRALQPPHKGAKIHYDESLPGFGIRITSNGIKSFVLTHGRRRQRKTLGRVGVISLKDARDAAKRCLATATIGKTAPKPVGWQTAQTEYLNEVKAKRKKRTASEYERLLKKYFKMGESKVSELVPDDFQKALNRISSTEHFHAYSALRAFLAWAHRKHYLDANPIHRMTVPKGSPPRSRILTDDELKKIWNAAGNDTYGRIVKLLILTGQRRGEISNLTGNMVEGDKLVLPAWLCKNSRQHQLPLGSLSQPLLKTHGTISLLFPAKLSRASRTSTSSPASFSGWGKSKAALDERSGVRDWTLHDLRRTFASGLAALGVQIPVIERLLNHVSGTFSGVVGIYNRYDYWKEMTDAVEKWEAHILSKTG